jgi:cytochrome c peroxidase
LFKIRPGRPMHILMARSRLALLSMGLKIFADVGCVQCHTGEYLGGSMFQKVGSVEQWPNQTDHGRYELTLQEGDRMQFKVPSLRNMRTAQMAKQ